MRPKPLMPILIMWSGGDGMDDGTKGRGIIRGADWSVKWQDQARRESRVGEGLNYRLAASAGSSVMRPNFPAGLRPRTDAATGGMRFRRTTSTPPRGGRATRSYGAAAKPREDEDERGRQSARERANSVADPADERGQQREDRRAEEGREKNSGCRTLTPWQPRCDRPADESAGQHASKREGQDSKKAGDGHDTA